MAAHVEDELFSFAARYVQGDRVALGDDASVPAFFPEFVAHVLQGGASCFLQELLDRLSSLRRMAEQAEKGARYLAGITRLLNETPAEPAPAPNA